MINLKKNIAFVKIFLTVVVVFCMTSQAKSETSEWCEKQWAIDSEETYEQDVPTYKELLQKWQQLSGKCSGTEVYEARLALAYLMLNQVDKARETLKPLVNKSKKYNYLVDFSLLHADVVEVEASDKINLDDVRQFEKKYLTYVKKYPDFPDAFGILGGYQMFLGKHIDAIKSLEIGLHSTMNRASIYRNLTISYAAVGRYNDALDASGKAFELNKKLTSDPFFAYALAKADAALGDYKSAQTVIKVIAIKVPVVKHTPEFKETIEFVMNEIDKKNK